MTIEKPSMVGVLIFLNDCLEFVSAKFAFGYHPSAGGYPSSMDFAVLPAN